MKIVVLTGAGISAESGVPTFRDADGLWEGHRVEDVATPEAYDAQPSAVHRFYDARRAALAAVEPNPAHHALARLEESLGDDLLVVTQNIDDLHERAGLTRVWHMHGELLSALCRGCRRRTPWTGDLGDYPPCPHCGVSELRPDVVWFGEMLPAGAFEAASEAARECEVFLSVGTSSVVYPAAALPYEALESGARLVEVNPSETPLTGHADHVLDGPAGEVLPELVRGAFPPPVR
jgi:NAD-dependent deacetylase